MPQTPRLGHIGISVTDLDKSVVFYQDAFNLVTIETNPELGYAFMGSDGQVTLTLWQQAAHNAPARGAGLHHLAFEVDTVSEVLEAEERIRELGAKFLYESIVAHAEGSDSGGIFFLDPDGNRLEIYAPKGITALAPTGNAPTCGFF